MRDAYAASLHDEKAFEYEALGHGLMTYVAKHQTPLHEKGELIDKLVKAGAWEVDITGQMRPKDSFVYPDQLANEVRTNLLDFDLVPFLSKNDQHVLDVMNTRILRVRGRGEIDLSDELFSGEVDVEDLYRRLEDLTRLPRDTGFRRG